MPEDSTVIVVVVAPVLHNNVPVKLPAVRTELPQLFTVDMDGADGIAFGFGKPLPTGLTHPFAVFVCVTV